MKRRFTILTAALVLLACLAIPMGMWGQTRQSVTIPMNQQGWSDAQVIGSGTLKDNTGANTSFEYTSDKGEASNAPTYYNSGTNVRFYCKKNGTGDGGSMTITPAANSGITITSVELTASNNYTPTTKYNVDGGSDEALTWSGTTGTVSNLEATTSFKFRNANAANNTNQLRITQIVITYTVAGADPTVETPTITPNGGSFLTSQEVSLACSTDGATIKYSTNNGSIWTDYVNSFTLYETTTVQAKAIKSGMTDSQVATATFTKVTPLANIAALTVNTTAGTYYVALDNAVVTYVNGNYAYIQDASGAVVMYKSDHGLIAGNVLNGTATVAYQVRNANPQITDLSGITPASGPAPEPTEVAASDWNYTFNNVLSQYFKVTGATITQSNSKYYVSLGGESIQLYKVGTAISDLDLTKTYSIIGFPTMYNSTKELQIFVNPEVEVTAEPSVTVTPNTINASAEGTDGALTLTYENITDFISFDYYFCDAEGNELQEDPDWIYAEIQDEDDTYSLNYIIDANDGAARTAYIKVYTFDDDLEEVYAIVTVNQEEYVAPTYAELPFEFDGGKAAIENTDGLYQEGLGNDYGSSPYLKFDGAGDYVLLQFEERPGILEFDIKGNGSGSDPWAGVFKVMVSNNGSTFVEKAVYETGDLTSTKTTMTIDDLASDVRYIKWIYTTKTKGNVALGNINLAAYVAPQPTITLNSYSIEATAEETEGSLTVTYTEIETDLGASIYWFESDGVTSASEPDWMSAEINTELNVEYLIEENEGAARTAYFKVYGADAELNDVYSNLVTVNQAAAPQQYTLTVEPFENLELITFVNEEMVMDGDGEIQVNEGDQIMLSIVADPDYVMETLMVNNVNHVNDIADDFTYTFDMPAENVTISATAVENVAPAGGNYVRITALDQLTDGSKVIIAARYDEEHTNGYYAMKNTTSGKPAGVAFTSETSGNDEILPATITASEDTYNWTVNVTNDGYTFTNAENYLIGYTSGTNFATGGNNTEWTITRETAEETTMVAEYTGFVIRNGNTDTRAFAFNGQAFGAYATSNMTSSQAAGYNFFLDFFVQAEAVEPETYTLNITGYQAGSTGGYYLIASPVTVDPASVDGMTDGDFDLYYFDQNEELEWVNYKAGENQINANFGNLTPGKGYLYAKQATTEGEIFHFELTGEPYSGNGKITLSKSDGVDWEGWNLVGNPFAQKAYPNREFYVMKDDGTEIVPAERDTVGAMEGIFVIAANDGEEMQFSTSPIGSKGQIVLNVTQNRGNVVDRAIVRFGQGGTLPKFMLNPNNTKMYIQMDDNDYAVVRSNKAGELPVNFEAAQNGTFTISVNTENLNVKYLHLIDRATGMDTDLLQTPSYKFDARTNDDPRRFVLVFKTGINIFDVFTTNSGNKEIFSFFSDGNWIINNEGEAILQVVDVNGRILSSEEINGSVSKRIEAAPGVYMLRLVNGDNVKVQKVVVK